MAATPESKGYFVISLDFELMWGMFDKVTSEDYGDALRNVSVVAPRLLHLFKEREIHATWATVGMLTAYHRAELQQLTPLEHERPLYERSELSAYLHLQQFKEQFDESPDLYLAPEIVQMICDTPGQELGSHTFSHYYCRETLTEESPNHTTAFAADALSTYKAFQRFSVEPTSIVFPRNQWTDEALLQLKRLGYRAYRGTERHFIYRARTDLAQNNPVVRMLRLIDQFFNITGHHTYRLRDVNPPHTPLVNVPASRFLRPRSKLLGFLAPLQLRRIKRAMTKAAKRGQIYHLWWHPHNFGRYSAKQFAFLEAILDHYQVLHTRYGWQSANMHEVATTYPAQAE